jgi:mono/diheme cytochrome c family protein
MRVLKRLVLGAVALILLAVGTVWAGSELVIRTTHDLPQSGFVASGSADAVAHGERLARALGCYDGCHGPGLAGDVFLDDPAIGRIVAANITEVVASYSDADLDRAIRRGIRPNGRSVLGMPSHLFRHMTDEDFDAVVSFLRSQPTVSNPDLPSTRLGPLARFGLMAGMFETNAVMAGDGTEAQVQIVAQRGYATSAAERRGHYLATLACADCHGADFGGDPRAAGGTPDLRMALAYDDDAFVALMREGRAYDGRDIGTMGDMYTHFGHFTDDEIESLLAFFRARAGGMSGATVDGGQP